MHGAIFHGRLQVNVFAGLGNPEDRRHCQGSCSAPSLLGTFEDTLCFDRVLRGQSARLDEGPEIGRDGRGVALPLFNIKY